MSGDGNSASDVPPELRVDCAKMPYLEGRYVLEGEWEGLPMWVCDTPDDEGVIHCIYSDGTRWKLCVHCDDDRSKGRCAFKAHDEHHGTALPHQMQEGWLRPPVAESESGLVSDAAISISLPHALRGIGPFPVGSQVQVVSCALLTSIVEDFELDHIPAEEIPSIASRSGTVTKHVFTPNSAYLVVTTDGGTDLPRLPSLAFA